MQFERLFRSDVSFSVANGMVAAVIVGDVFGASINLVGLYFVNVDTHRALLVGPNFAQQTRALVIARRRRLGTSVDLAEDVAAVGPNQGAGPSRTRIAQAVGRGGAEKLSGLRGLRERSIHGDECAA